VMGSVESNEVAVLLNLGAAVHNGISKDRHSNHPSQLRPTLGDIFLFSQPHYLLRQDKSKA
jgi:hypothetical protein